MKTFTNLIKRASLSTFNKKRYYLFIIMLLTLGIGQVWATETELFSQTYPGSPTKYTGSYTSSFSLTTDDYTLTYANINNGQQKDAWTAIRSGSKNNVSVATITSGLVKEAISKVVVSFTQVIANKTNSLYLEVSSNSNFSSSTKVTATIAVGDIEFVIPTPSENQYYRITIDQAKGSANGFNRFDEITFYKSESSETPDEPTCTTITPTLNYSATSLVQGGTATPTLEGNTGNGEVTFETSNAAVATVNANGTVTAVGAGTATITANIAAAGEYCDGKATTTITVIPLVSCSEVYNLADDAKFALKEFVVTYVNGKYTYIKDDTGYGVIYTTDGEYGLKAGDKVASGKLYASKTTFKGLVEIIPTTAANDLGATPGTAPDPEVMNVAPANADINKYAKFEGVTFASTAFSSKSITGNVGGSNVTFYDQFSTNETFDTSKKYNVVGCVSIYNSLQVNFISAEEVAEPTLNISTSGLDFGKVKNGSTNEQTFTIQGSQLTKDVTLTIEGDHFTVSPTTLTPTEGSLNQTITVTYSPTAEGNHTATLKITSDELTEQTVSLQGSAVAEYTVHFYVNQTEETELAKQVLSGDKLDAMPAEPTSCDPLNYPTFIGWSTSEINGTTTEEPTNLLDLNTAITSDCNYYAVFAKSTTTGSAEDTETITIANFKDGVDADGTQALYESTSATWEWLKNSSSSKINTTYEQIRLYASHTLTISPKAGYTITKIVAAISENKYVTPFAAGGLTGATSSADGLNVTLTPISGDIVITQAAQSRATSFTVTYAAASTENTYLTTCESVTPTYTVTYNLDGGSSTCETSVVVEKDGELTLCDAPTKTGHTFLKWKDQSDNEYEAGTTITVSSDLTLTAQWQKESYKVTWMSLGTEVASADVEYNAQPTKPAEDPTYTCLSGTKEFVGWTTQEIDGVGVPANLYTEEFLVVTEPITYYAVFAGKSAEASITTNTLLVTDKLGNYISGNMKDDQQSVWNYFAGGNQDGETLYLALRNKESEISYIESPKFAGTVQSIVAHVKNGSGTKARTVYLRSSAIVQPTEGDLGETSISASNNSEVTLNITPSFDKFFIQVSEGLQFHKIVVTSGIAAGAYIDYITSCEAVTSSIAIEDVTMNVGDTHTITATITPAAAASAVKYAIKENEANAISLEGATITALAEGTATITATIEDAVNYTGTTVDFTVKVNPAPVTDKVVILAQHDGKWYAMKAEYLSDNTDRLVGVPVNYIDGKLYEVDDAIKPLIEWDRTTSVDNVTFQNNSKYLKGKTNTVLNLEAEATGLYQWNSDYTMVLSGSSTVRTFLYNGEAFRNFAVSNAGKVVNDVLYSELPVVAAPVYETGQAYGRSVNLGTDGYRYGTICLPFGSTNFTGAEFFECVGKEEGKVFIGSVTTLVAGTPYIFLANASEVAVYGDGTTAATAGSSNGLHGTFANDTEVAVGNYILLNNEFCQAEAICYVNANRAYLVMSEVPGEFTRMPGRRYIGMSVTGENEATGFEDITAPADKAVKAIINGQLIIIRDGEMYNAQGQLIK